MLFNSIDFLVFFPIIVLILFLVPGKMRVPWLLAVSYYFYMCWNITYALLLLFSTISTYIIGIILEKTQKIEKRKLYIACCCVINFGILFIFKYFNFFTENINGILNNCKR